MNLQLYSEPTAMNFVLSFGVLIGECEREWRQKQQHTHPLTHTPSSAPEVTLFSTALWPGAGWRVSLPCIGMKTCQRRLAERFINNEFEISRKGSAKS
jgi:hypothetical protein